MQKKILWNNQILKKKLRKELVICITKTNTGKSLDWVKRYASTSEPHWKETWHQQKNFQSSLCTDSIIFSGISSSNALLQKLNKQCSVVELIFVVKVKKK